MILRVISFNKYIEITTGVKGELKETFSTHDRTTQIREVLLFSPKAGVTDWFSRWLIAAMLAAS